MLHDNMTVEAPRKRIDNDRSDRNKFVKVLPTAKRLELEPEVLLEVCRP